MYLGTYTGEKKKTARGGVKRCGRSQSRVSTNEQNCTNLHRGRSSESSTLVCTLPLRHIPIVRVIHLSTIVQQKIHVISTNERIFSRKEQRTESKYGLRERLLHNPAALLAAHRFVLQRHGQYTLYMELPKERDEVCLNNVLLDGTNVE